MALPFTVIGQAPNLPLTLQRIEGDVAYIRGGMKSTLLDTISHYSGVPKEVDKYLIKYIKLTDDDFFGSSKLAILIGKTLTDSIVVMVDENFDSNFSDEKVLLYPKEKKPNFIGANVTLKKIIEGRSIVYTFSPYPYKTNFKYNSTIENEFSLMVQTCQYLKGVFKMENVDNAIYIGNKKPFAFYTNSPNLEINVGSLENFFVGQIIPLKEKNIVIDSVSKYGERLYYKIIDSTNSHLFTGYSKGLQVIPINAYDIDRQSVKIPAVHKVQLLDFWGTWCKPCHETLPVLKRMHKKYQDLEIIGIAYDADVTLVKKYIKREKVLWKNIFQGYSGNEHPLISAISVEVYPTFILIDEFGKVIFRGDGVEAIFEVEKVLDTMYGNKH